MTRYGLNLRPSGRGVRQAFRVGLDGTARIVRNEQGARLDLRPAVASTAPGAGRSLHLQAACREVDDGTRLTLWIDGTLLIDVTDAQPLPNAPQGQVGLMARAPEENGGGALTVSFDDFTVLRLG